MCKGLHREWNTGIHKHIGKRLQDAIFPRSAQPTHYANCKSSRPGKLLSAFENEEVSPPLPPFPHLVLPKPHPKLRATANGPGLWRQKDQFVNRCATRRRYCSDILKWIMIVTTQIKFGQKLKDFDSNHDLQKLMRLHRWVGEIYVPAGMHKARWCNMLLLGSKYRIDQFGNLTPGGW